ncbi:MAG: DUF2461 domain-containing protein [Bacteroidota bacterium]
MARSSFIDLDIYPPFEGFPKEGIAFLKRLKRNNHRVWFGDHKAEYESFVKLPMQSLIAALKPRITQFAPDIYVDPRRSMFRIYRDTRFSQDKTPYKTHVAAIFHPRGRWRESAGLYLEIAPRYVGLAGGIYMPESAQLKLIRKAIAERSEEFLAIVEEKNFRKLFGGLEGNTLQRVPQGYPADHPVAKWLKYKQLYLYVEWPESKCYGQNFVDEVIKVFQEMMPLVRFLNEAVD